MKTTIMAVVAACTLSGCIGFTPKYSPAEMDAITTRRYEGATPDQVYSAATAVFEAADRKNFKISREGNGLDARRTRIIFPSWNHFNWTVTAEEVGGSTLVRAKSTSLIGSREVPNITGKAIYELFFERVQYVLGKSEKWSTCADADKRIYAQKGLGTVEALCMGSDDAVPDRLVTKTAAKK